MTNRSLAELVDEQLGMTLQPAVPARQSTTTVHPVGGAAAGSSDVATEAEKIASVLDYVVKSRALEKIATAPSTGGPRPETNASEVKPKGTINTLAANRRTSHPAFANAKTVAAATPGDVARENTPALRQAFNAVPYSDPVTDTVLAHKVDHKDVNARLSRARAAKLRRKGASR